MGRASRKKKRPRGQAGGLYSSLFVSGVEESTFKTFRDIDSGKHEFNLHGRKIDNSDDFFSMTGNMLNRGKRESLGHIDVLLTWATYKHAYQNIYIADKDVMQFIEDQRISNTDFEYAADIMKDKVTKSYSKFNVNIYPVCIHMIDRDYSILAMFVDTDKTVNKHDAIAFRQGDGQGMSNIGFMPVYGVPDDIVAGRFKDNDYVLDGTSYEDFDPIYHVVLNTFLYMDAFPDCVKDGPPPVRMPAGEQVRMSRIITKSPEIEGCFGHDVSPHLRRGHYRFLKAERFKKKRYQTVWVRPTMIKGTAEHVVAAE